MRADWTFQGGAFSSSGGRFFFVRGALFFFKGGPFWPIKNAQLNSGGLKPPGIKIACHNYEKQGYLGQGIYVHIFRYFLNGIQQGQCVISNNADVYRVKVQVLQVDKLYALKAANLWLPFLMSSYFLLLVNYFVQSRVFL